MKQKNFFWDMLIALYFFNMSVLDNGTMLSKIGKIIFVVLTCAYILNSKKLSLKYREYYFWEMLIILYSVLSINWSYSHETAFDGLKTVLLNYLCIFLLTQLLAKRDDWFLVISKCIIIFPNLLFIRLLFQYGFSIFTGMRYLNNASYNKAGMFAGLGMAFGIYFYAKTKGSSKKFIYTIIINSVLLLISLSRKAVLFFAIPIIIVYLLTGKKIMRKFIRIIILIIILVLVVFLIMKIPLLYNYIGKGLEKIINYQIKGSGDISAAGRNTRIQFGIKKFYERPWLGWGLSNYNYLFKSFEKTTNMVIADNNYIDLLVNFGIIGISLYYILYLYAFKLWLKIRYKNNIDVVFPIALLFMLLIMDYGVSSYIYLHSQTLLALSFCWIKIVFLEEEKILNELRNMKIK